jgi:3-phosphoshikimate 1-carboxyvinyltransferase
MSAKQREIVPIAGPPHAAVRVPGSKSITNRALVLAALSSRARPCRLHGMLRAEDTEVCAVALERLGFRLSGELGGAHVLEVVNPHPARVVPNDSADLFVANSGTTMRFLTALVSLGHGRYLLDGVARMRERPIDDLLDALGQLEVRAFAEHNNGCPPVVVEARGLRGGHVRIKGDISSQFLSGLLMAAPLADGPITMEVVGPLVSRPYVAMTVAMMRQFGAQVEEPTANSFRVQARPYPGIDKYTIEPDASAASYILGAAAVSGGEVKVFGLSQHCLQGDVAFATLLEQMGCTVTEDADGITVRGGPLHGIDVDMNDISDTVMTLAAVACFANGPTTIRNVAHIRHKETDRLAALATELRRVGAGVEEFADGLTITPQPLHGAEIETYNDHRMAMSMALVGLRVPGIVIKDPGCVAKTYPEFFADLEQLRH